MAGRNVFHTASGMKRQRAVDAGGLLWVDARPWRMPAVA